MYKQIFFSVLMAVSPLGADCCTNLIVGKDASTDGSVMCTYSADDYGMFQNLCHYPAARHPKGTMRQVYDWDTNAYNGQIPESPVTYNVIGNINEYQVTIAETTFGGREEMVDSTGTLDYGSLIYIGLQRSRTAREAIEVMTTLAERYGYNSYGETFTICDPDEAWIMEMMGCGPGSKSVVWVAVRIPDNAICAHANQSRIRKFDRKDKDNVMYSKNVVSFAPSKGWYDGTDADFDFCSTYAAPDFGGRRWCEARVWSFFNRFAKSMDKYVPYAEGHSPNAEPMPLWIVPERKLSLADLEAAMRDHYEGTPFALDKPGDIGGGIWQMPYRPTPLEYEVDGQKCFNERPISTQQAGFVFVSQMRSWLPRQIGGVLWFANDDANMVPFTPIYCCVNKPPHCYDTPGADAVTFSPDNAFWIQNWVSNMVYPRYSQMFPALRAVRDSLDSAYIAFQPEAEARASELYAQSADKAVAYLNGYSAKCAEEMLGRWKKLAVFLIVKYNDMTVKPDSCGRFLRSPHGLGATVERPGYPAAYAREMEKLKK